MKYITQKDILRRFRDEDGLSEITVYYSYVGNYTINSRKTSTIGFDCIEPTMMTLFYDDDGLLCSLAFDGLDEKKRHSVLTSMFTSNRNNNPLYPLNEEIVDRFEAIIDTIDSEGNKIEWHGSILDKIKFFDTLDGAELNFVVLLRDYLERNKLVQALSTYDKIIDKHSIKNPSELIKHI